MIQDKEKMSNKLRVILGFMAVILLTTASFAFGYIMGITERVPIIIEKCSE